MVKTEKQNGEREIMEGGDRKVAKKMVRSVWVFEYHALKIGWSVFCQ